LLQIFEPDPFNGRHVKEEIFPAACVDETKTLVRQSLDSAFGHAGRYTVRPPEASANSKSPPATPPAPQSAPKSPLPAMGIAPRKRGLFSCAGRILELTGHEGDLSG
jgi:hypothetical protein